MKVINYPDGRKMILDEKKDKKIDHRKTENKTEAQRIKESYIKANMGMDFEKDVSKSCDYYRLQGIADIYKRPTPIKIVKMNKQKPGQICEAYFEEKSTTDYVGIIDIWNSFSSLVVSGSSSSLLKEPKKSTSCPLKSS